MDNGLRRWRSGVPVPHPRSVAGILIDALLAEGGGVVVVRRHPRQRRALYRLVEAGVLVAVLPGVLAPAAARESVETRIRALGAYDDDVVLTRWAAARLTFWPQIAVPIVTASLPRIRKVPAGFEVVREALPRALIRSVGGVRVTAPELTALDLALTDDGAALDRVLRTGLVSFGELSDVVAVLPNRHGNQTRRRWLDDSRRRPWSTAERELHRLLRKARIGGWRGNRRVVVGRSSHSLDVVFDEVKVAIEVDGYEFHRAEQRLQFHRDRRKWTELAAAGWIVLHFTWEHLTEDPDWVLGRVREALRRARARRAS